MDSKNEADFQNWKKYCEKRKEYQYLSPFHFDTKRQKKTEKSLIIYFFAIKTHHKKPKKPAKRKKNSELYSNLSMA